MRFFMLRFYGPVNIRACGARILHKGPFRALVCIEVLRPSQPNGFISRVASLPNHTFTGQAQSSKRLTNIVHILSPQTDNCPSRISGRRENIS